MKKILYCIYITVILIILLINIFSIFHISFFGFRVYRVGSGSMEPELKVNDFILVKKEDKYEIDDIVTYQNKREYVTHRIIEINEDTIITKGDANNTADEAITMDSIIGKIVIKSHVLGFILYLFSKPVSWILLFLIGIITVMFLNRKEKVSI